MIVKRFIRFTAESTQNQTKYKFGFSSSNLGGSNSLTPNYPKIMLKKSYSTLPIGKRDNVAHSRDRAKRKFRFIVFSEAPLDYNFLVI
eukprot:SAG11_NODE_2234_length_3654_cov_7.757806_1_plen_88_part_00